MTAKTNTSPNAKVEPSAEIEADTGTTNQLFGGEAPAVPEVKGEPNAVVEGQEAVAQETKGDPTETEYLNIEDFGNKKVKTKVDGVEEEVSFDELLKGYQLNKTLSEKGQKLGLDRQTMATERKSLEELRAKVEGLASGQQVAPQATPSLSNVDFDMMDESTRNAFIAQDAKNTEAMAAISQQLQQLSVGLQPIQLEQGYRQMDAALKSENPAYSDFMSKTAEIEAFIISLPVERQAEYGTPLGYMSVYKDIKNRELLAQVSNPGNENPSLVPRTESGGGSSTGVSAGELSESKKLFAEAKDASIMKDIRDYHTVDPLAKWGAVLDNMAK